MFDIGQKVVCIDDTPRNPSQKRPGIVVPKKGVTYTIRDIYESVSSPGKIGLILEEIKNPVNDKWGKELGFNADRFKPLISPESEAFADAVLKKITKQIEEEILTGITKD